MAMWHTQSEVADQQQQEYFISHSSGGSLSSTTAVEVASINGDRHQQERRCRE